jgi:hypothetical protein
MRPPRRDFLGWFGSASLLGIAGSPAIARAAVAPGNNRAIDAHDPPVSEVWDMSWAARVTGKYKAVFDSPEVSSGAAVYRAVAWCEQYKEVYGAARTDMSAVVVLRHLGFYLAMNDDFWLAHETGKSLKLKDDRGKKWQKENPLGAAAGAAQPTQAKFTVPGFIADGGIVLACGWSFGGAVSQIMRAEKLTREEASVRAKTLLIPGVILQPNGIFAALRAQEAGCSYIMAS